MSIWSVANLAMCSFGIPTLEVAGNQLSDMPSRAFVRTSFEAMTCGRAEDAGRFVGTVTNPLLLVGK